VSKAVVDPGPELALRRGRHMRVNAMRERVQCAGCGMGCLPASVVCLWAVLRCCATGPPADSAHWPLICFTIF
jgi:hypothetical protein